MYVLLKTNGIKFVYRVALRSYSVSSFGFLQYLHVQCKPRTINCNYRPYYIHDKITAI